ncbi:sensor histidine kinase [Salisaeta longa]|uniref:sensor histidine kinase n=1 Tax=Salisaeta longa TaxID=503170 RepID=UPI0003B6DD99|nr:HAMP domain-containing sensor histidine kinase [Salisaeta longa]
MFKKLGDLLLPKRASTQTWMVLTFALFVGTAVVLAALYVTTVLRSEMHTAMRKTLSSQMHRLAVQVTADTSTADLQRTVSGLEQLTDLHVAIVTPDTTYGHLPDYVQRNSDFMQAGAALHYMRQENGPSGPVFFAARTIAPARTLVIGQPAPPLYALAQRTQVVLILGMVLALILAIIGSWVAAYQVTTPLKAISNTAKRVADGRLAGRISVESRAAEFQDLAESLNRASEAFREKIEELERLAQLQNEFIGNVSHEVRNPILAISGYLEALSSTNLTDAMQKRFAEKGLTNLQRLSNLFEDLIEIARLEYREDLISRQEFNLKGLVREVADMLRPKADKKDLVFDTDVQEFYVNADRARIRQVLVNLMDNAIAYTDEGSVRCRVTKRLDKVRIEVVDTGKGIPEEHLDRIFERFHRVDRDRSRESGGTGLGLSIVQQIVQAHGEKVHVESTQGRGTRFWFELPHASVPASVEA